MEDVAGKVAIAIVQTYLGAWLAFDFALVRIDGTHLDGLLALGCVNQKLRVCIENWPAELEVYHSCSVRWNRKIRDGKRLAARCKHIVCLGCV